MDDGNGLADSVMGNKIGHIQAGQVAAVQLAADHGTE
ncbi:hypothetical protein METH_22015 (plasmid) [Leisingera methylohalidivorans DSM 14336]|uniref:Uncharacterized protein n=1 Tax=Leisingera methylohalidivorans DSM 14336 TaxID=999552 RepID=V9VXN9_9RHOB|nr:hypothetical protein METH_22015 [Leisingera methylohalidivorans DSM 14336]